MKKDPMWQFTVRIDPNGKPFKQIQVFTLRSPDKDKAEAELVRLFRRFANWHGWRPKLVAILLREEMPEAKGKPAKPASRGEAARAGASIAKGIPHPPIGRKKAAQGLLKHPVKH